MTRLMGPSHMTCPDCGRLLAPVDGALPRHRRPKRNESATMVPLTGLDAPWCGSPLVR